MRILLALAFLLITLLTSPMSISAHTGTSCDEGHEATGYVLHCGNQYGHAGSTTIQYDYSYYDLEQKFKDAANQAAARWNNTGIVNITKMSVAGGGNTISTYSDTDTSTVAFVRTYSVSYGHKISWDMYFNEGNPSKDWTTTATHEFGHAIGLADLYHTEWNKGKLMYGYESRDTNYPTDSDKRGAREGVK